jgi:hypothetical protein
MSHQRRARVTLRSTVAVTVIATTAFLFAGCATVRGLVDDALGAALESVAAETIKQVAQQQGAPIAGDVNCNANVSTESKSATLACNATTTTGDPVTAEGSVVNVTDSKTCSGTITIKIGALAPITKKLPSCSS